MFLINWKWRQTYAQQLLNATIRQILIYVVVIGTTGVSRSFHEVRTTYRTGSLSPLDIPYTRRCWELLDSLPDTKAFCFVVSAQFRDCEKTWIGPSNWMRLWCSISGGKLFFASFQRNEIKSTENCLMFDWTNLEFVKLSWKKFYSVVIFVDWSRTTARRIERLTWTSKCFLSAFCKIAIWLNQATVEEISKRFMLPFVRYSSFP